MDSVKPSHVPTREEITQAARDLVPVLRERAVATEERRDLLPETIADLKAAGIHKIFTPKRYGGFEMDWGTHVDVTKELRRGCGSTHGGIQWDASMWPIGKRMFGLKTGDPKIDDAVPSPLLDKALIS